MIFFNKYLVGNWMDANAGLSLEIPKKNIHKKVKTKRLNSENVQK